jgi:hypothetical protein
MEALAIIRERRRFQPGYATSQVELKVLMMRCVPQPVKASPLPPRREWVGLIASAAACTDRVGAHTPRQNKLDPRIH